MASKRHKELSLSVEKRRNLEEERAEMVRKARELKADWERREAERKAR